MQVEVKTYKYDSRNLMIANTRDKTCTVSDVLGDKGKALAALAYTIALIGPETKFVLSEAVYGAMNRNPHTDISIIVARPDKVHSHFVEIMRLDPRNPVELQEDQRGSIVEALAEAIGLMFLPEARSNQPAKIDPPPVIKPDTSIPLGGYRFGELPVPLPTAQAATVGAAAPGPQEPVDQAAAGAEPTQKTKTTRSKASA